MVAKLVTCGIFLRCRSSRDFLTNRSDLLLIPPWYIFVINFLSWIQQHGTVFPSGHLGSPVALQSRQKPPVCSCATSSPPKGKERERFGLAHLKTNKKKNGYLRTDMSRSVSGQKWIWSLSFQPSPGFKKTCWKRGGRAVFEHRIRLENLWTLYPSTSESSL